MGWANGSEKVNHGRRTSSGSGDWRCGTTKTLLHPTMQCGGERATLQLQWGPPQVFPWTWDVAGRGGHKIRGEEYLSHEMSRVSSRDGRS